MNEIHMYAICPNCGSKYQTAFGDAFHCHVLHDAGGCPNCGCDCANIMSRREVRTKEKRTGKKIPYWKVRKFNVIRGHWESTGEKWFFGLFNKKRYVKTTYIEL